MLHTTTFEWLFSIVDYRALHRPAICSKHDSIQFILKPSYSILCVQNDVLHDTREITDMATSVDQCHLSTLG